jgi:hypothetical protein
MTDALERELRAALAEKAATLPAESRERLRQLDYARRARRPVRRLQLWQLAGVAGCGLTAGALTLALMLSSGGGLVPLAYAGYSATPDQPTPVALSRVTARCKRIAGPLAQATTLDHPILAERRGRYIAALFATKAASALCLAAGSEVFSVGAAGTGNRTAPPMAGKIAPPVIQGSGAPAGHGWASVWQQDAWGRAGRGVTGVVFVFAGNETVTATVRHGWFFAWWPARRIPARVRVRNTTGTVSSPTRGIWCLRHQHDCAIDLLSSSG